MEEEDGNKMEEECIRMTASVQSKGEVLEVVIVVVNDKRDGMEMVVIHFLQLKFSMFQETVEVTVTSLLPCTPYNITIEPTAKGETASLYFDNFNVKVKVSGSGTICVFLSRNLVQRTNSSSTPFIYKTNPCNKPSLYETRPQLKW